MSKPATADVMPVSAAPSAVDRALWALALLVSWPVVAIAAWLRPDPRGFGTHQQLGMPPCAFEAATHVPCPGCGLTTSFTNMAHFHFIAAFRAHLMGPLLFTLTLAVALVAPYAIRRGWSVTRALSLPWLTTYLAVTLGAGLITFGARLAHKFL